MLTRSSHSLWDSSMMLVFSCCSNDTFIDAFDFCFAILADHLISDVTVLSMGNGNQLITFKLQCFKPISATRMSNVYCYFSTIFEITPTYSEIAFIYYFIVILTSLMRDFHYRCVLLLLEQHFNRCFWLLQFWNPSRSSDCSRAFNWNHRWGLIIQLNFIIRFLLWSLVGHSSPVSALYSISCKRLMLSLVHIFLIIVRIIHVDV